MLKRILITALLTLFVTACVKNGPGIDTGVSFPLLNSYASIKRDFERGLIMQARERVLELDKEHRDYAAAHKLLDQKIEPARRRIFVHYLRSARQFEKEQKWHAAMDAYGKAKDVTIKPEQMEQKRVEMETRMRQLRLDRLLRQRREEDATWMQNLAAYDPPKGLDSEDEVFLRQRKIFNQLLDERADDAYDEARRYLREDRPEIAYVEIESHLRLQPNSDSGKSLMAEIRQKLPAELKLEPEATAKKSMVVVKRVSAYKTVTASQISDAIQEGRLMEARQLLQRYRRSGGQGAAKLASQLDRRIAARAQQLFEQGSEAFQKEELDKAIAFWRDAVTLMPGQSEYAEALHRARQLKERLNLLRSQKDNDPIPDVE
ncbi:hypothetical protein Ga0123462_0320 [Mariprofundus ferrinatatus]|uniref:Tetratricopeptide repeat-containing protein n=1 Tax=Mariprofundus ferrinatatus TaxID=1921087 RepID=A0A2K8L1K3_9PROT|nr:hypothetical protein Ga0123462_0320 [Mariprofundus ferrinatatus]